MLFSKSSGFLKSLAETSIVHQSKCRLSTQWGVHPGELELNTKQEKSLSFDCCLCFGDRKREVKREREKRHRLISFLVLNVG